MKQFRTSFFPFEGQKIEEFFETLKSFHPDLVLTRYRDDATRIIVFYRICRGIPSEITSFWNTTFPSMTAISEFPISSFH